MHSQVLEPSHLDMLTRVLHHAASRTGINSTRTMRRTSPLTLVYLFQRAMVNEFDLIDTLGPSRARTYAALAKQSARPIVTWLTALWRIASC